MSIIAKPQFPGEPAVRQGLMAQGVTGDALELLVTEETVDGSEAHGQNGLVRRLWDTACGFVVESVLAETRQAPSPDTTTALARLVLVAEAGYHGIRRHAALRPVAGPKRGPRAGDWNAAVVAAIRWRFADRLLRLDPFTLQIPAVSPMLSLSHNVMPSLARQERAWTPNSMLFPASGSRLLPRAWLRPLVLEGLRTATGRRTRYRWPGLEFGGNALDWSHLANALLDDVSGGGKPESDSDTPTLIIQPAK